MAMDPVATTNQASKHEHMKEGDRERFKNALKQLHGMAEVETLMRSRLVAEAPLLVEISEYLRSLGGKRMRPALCLLIYKLLGSTRGELPEDLVDVAAGIELIHMATLLHDDIIDNSPLRRHKDSPLLKYGGASTLLTGDFLLVRAFALCSRLDSEIIAATEKACVELTEGEILETPLWKEPHSRQSSLLIAEKKTAALFWLASFSAAHIACGDVVISQHFRDFGRNLGIAFQVLDDVLDVLSNEETLGKQPGTDIRERKPSIVNILWMLSDSPLSERVCQKPIPAEEDSFVESALQELRSSKVIDEARAIAQHYASEAKVSLRAGVEAARSHGCVRGLPRTGFSR